MKQDRHFLLTDFAIRKKTTFFVLTLMIVIFGLISYFLLPKEDMPDIKIPYVFVSTIYPGVAPEDIEVLLTKPIENELKTLTDVKRVSSISAESISSIAIEFNTDVDIDDALQKVRDKVSLARSDLPEDAEDPLVEELNFDSIPALIISLSGPYDLIQLKDIGEKLEDSIDTVPGVLETEIVGGLENEIRVIVDSEKLDLYELSLDDVVLAIRNENITMPGGNIDIGAAQYNIRIPGEFQRVSEIDDIIIDTSNGRVIYLKDVATVERGFKEQKTLSRYKTKNSVSLLITRRTGENLINLSDAIYAELERNSALFPPDLSVSVVGDRAEMIRDMVNELINSILTGVVLVVAVLFFFFGLRNAFFVGIAIPLSMLMSFAVLRAADMTLNMVVLFSLILALGMLVDNGIVIVENIFRHYQEGKSSVTAAEIGTGEVAWPVITSTFTTLAAFFPLIFWPGIMGEFMSFLPITLVIALLSSLFVALFITPVFCAAFMKRHKEKTELTPQERVRSSAVLTVYHNILTDIIRDETGTPSRLRRTLLNMAAVVCLIAGIIIVMTLNSGIEYALHLKPWEQVVKVLDHFGWSLFLGTTGTALILFVFFTAQHPKRHSRYAGVTWLAVFIVLLIISVPFLDRLSGWARLFAGALFLLPLVILFRQFRHFEPAWIRRNLLIHSFFILFIASVLSVGFLDILFFPQVTPERIFIRLEMAPGTSLEKTNEVISRVEAIVADLEKTPTTNIRHFVTNIGSSSGDPFSGGAMEPVNRAEITIHFYKNQERQKIARRHDVSLEEISPLQTVAYLRERIKTIPGGKITIVEEEGGPPTGKPISIEIRGDDFTVLRQLAAKVMSVVTLSEGVINLEDTFEQGGAEIRILIDREKAAFYGVSTARIASTIRTAVTGETASVFREEDDEVDITVKLDERDVRNIGFLRYLTIPGSEDRRVPLINVATIETTSGLGSIRRIDFNRVVDVEAEVAKESGRTPADIINEINANLEKADINPPKGYTIRFRGQQEEQQESMVFLSQAFLVAIFLIALILISQFNSVIMPAIILFSVVLSFIGVVVGLFLSPLIFEFRAEPSAFVVVMTGVGVISLAGVVVNNAIVLLDYIRQLRDEGLPKTEAIIQAGVVRFRPVMLTAITTVLGLVPMSTGISLDFTNRIFFIIPTLITNSSSSEWWAPLSNAVIFGLGVATILTLIMVPIFYYVLDVIDERLSGMAAFRQDTSPETK